MCYGSLDLERSGARLNFGVILRLEQCHGIESKSIGQTEQEGGLIGYGRRRLQQPALDGWCACAAVVGSSQALAGAAHVRPTGGDKHKQKQSEPKRKSHIHQVGRSVTYIFNYRRPRRRRR